MTKNPFLIDIDIDKPLPDYDLVLCKMNEVPLQDLVNVEDLEVKKFLAGIDEITFSVPFYRTESTGHQVKNEIYDVVDGGMMVLVDGSKYFILTKPSVHTNEDTGEITKKMIGFSREYELAQKRLVGYEAASRMLYDRSNVIDSSGDFKGMHRGFLNFVEKTTSWKVEYFNQDLALKFRHLTFSKTTYLQAFSELQKTFGCIFKFDTMKKTISVYKADQLGTDKGMYISDKNFISSLKQDINHDEIKTRLYLYGEKNVSIQEMNITGQPYIENLTFYKNTKYMSQALIDALNGYDAFVKTKEGQFKIWLKGINDTEAIALRVSGELTALNTQRKEIENRQDVIISTGQPTSAVALELKKKVTEIVAKEAALKVQTDKIAAFEVQLKVLGESLSMNNYIKDEALAKELDPFIREDEYTDANYNETNLDELWVEGQKILDQISYPHIQFDVEVDDFLSMVGAQHIWDRFLLGDIVTLEHEALGFDYKVKLIAYTHNNTNNTLKLTFSNKDSVDDPNIYLKDLIEGLSTTSSTVDFNKYRWDKGETADLEITKYIDGNLDLAKQDLLVANGQRKIADDRGIWLTKQDADKTINGAQMRLINNMLAITKDNWNNVEVAISAENGVNANVVSGKLGQFAKLSANQIEIGGENGRISFVELGTPDGSTGSAYVTTLTRNTITTEKLMAENLEVNFANVKGTIVADTVKTDWVYAGNVKADQLLIGGTNGTISFENLSGKPDITKITNDTVSTTTVNAVNLKVQSANIQGTITADGVKAAWIYGGNIKADQLLIGGANGRISFSELADKENVLNKNSADSKDYITTISKDTIRTANIQAKQILIGGANGNINFNQLSGSISWGTITGAPVVRDGYDGAPGRDGKDGKKGLDATLPQFIKGTYIDGNSVSSPILRGGTIEGAKIVSVGTHNTIELQNSSRQLVGAISYNSSRSEMWIRSENNYKIKIESAGNMSIAPGNGMKISQGTTAFQGHVTFLGGVTGVTATAVFG